jgi:hypothetical protein
LKYLIFILFAALSVISTVFYSQKPMSVSIGAGAGGLAPHKAVTAHLLKGPSYKFESSLTFKTNGDKTYQVHYKYPYYGLTVAYNNSGSPTLIGNLYSINLFGALPLYNGENPVRFRTGIGLGYATLKFDKLTNHKNSAIGSHFNVNIQLRLEKDFQITKINNINIGIGISHYSNASVQKPNLGLNFFHLHLNTVFRVKEIKTIDSETENKIDILPYDLWETSVLIGSGIRENITPLGSKFFIGVITLQQTRRLSEFSSWSGALDNYINMSMYDEQNKWYQLGISTTFMKHFDKLKVGLGLGTYLLNRPYPEATVYNKVIIEYQITKRLFTQLLLKSHWAAADFFNLTFGYKIK